MRSVPQAVMFRMPKPRLTMQRAMQSHIGVFRMGSTSGGGYAKDLTQPGGLQEQTCSSVTDGSLVWNRDLIGSFETGNLLTCASQTAKIAFDRSDKQR